MRRKNSLLHLHCFLRTPVLQPCWHPMDGRTNRRGWRIMRNMHSNSPSNMPITYRYMNCVWHSMIRHFNPHIINIIHPSFSSATSNMLHLTACQYQLTTHLKWKFRLKPSPHKIFYSNFLSTLIWRLYRSILVLIIPEMYVKYSEKYSFVDFLFMIFVIRNWNHWGHRLTWVTLARTSIFFLIFRLQGDKKIGENDPKFARE